MAYQLARPLIPWYRPHADTRHRSCRVCPFSPAHVLLWALRAGAATMLFGANMVALTRVDDLGGSTHLLSRLHVWDGALRAHARVEPLEAANAYGLFRRMTGAWGRMCIGRSAGLRMQMQ